jgi:hypothetical protein
MNQQLAAYFILFLYLRQKSYFIHTVYMKGERDRTFEPMSNRVKNRNALLDQMLIGWHKSIIE